MNDQLPPRREPVRFLSPADVQRLTAWAAWAPPTDWAAAKSLDVKIDDDAPGHRYRFADSPRLAAVNERWDSGLLPHGLRVALFALGSGFVVVRPGPVVDMPAPGASLSSFEFDLSERAVELLAAAGASRS